MHFLWYSNYKLDFIHDELKGDTAAIILDGVKIV
jgi:hypothetical protein